MNPHLIETYATVRDSPNELMARLSTYSLNRHTFEYLRSLRSADPVDRAARFCYLNRAAFNGLYRVNQRGEFNVPFGCKPGTVLFNEANVIACSKILQRVVLANVDFEDVLSEAKSGQRLYIDPPFATTDKAECFHRYTPKTFGWSDQLRLASAVKSVVARGAHIVISNACHPDILRLYSDRQFRCFHVSRRCSIAAAAQYRTLRREMLLVSRSIDVRPAEVQFFGDEVGLRIAPLTASQLRESI